MKKFILSCALFAGLFAVTPPSANAASLSINVGRPGVNVAIGYPRPFYATVQETVIIGYRTVVDQWGRIVTVPVYGVQYRTVLVQYDAFSRQYFYYNSLGQAVPYYGSVPRW